MSTCTMWIRLRRSEVESLMQMLSQHESEMAGVGAFHLRDYRPSDLPRLSEIDRECFPPEVACAADQLRTMMREDRGFAIVAEVGGEGVVAFVIAANTGPKLGHIVSLDVLSRFRRQGIGAALMHAAEERLSDSGVETLRLETPEFSRAAQRLYRKLGFRRVGFIERYYPNGAGGWVMEKPFLAALPQPQARDAPGMMT